MSLILAYDAMAELAAKAQQLPHMPWSLTWVMTPWSLQSTDSGRSSSLISFLLGMVKFVHNKLRVPTQLT